MSMMSAAPPLVVTDAQRVALERITQSSSMSHCSVVKTMAPLVFRGWSRHLRSGPSGACDVELVAVIASTARPKGSRVWAGSQGRGLRLWLPGGAAVEVIRAALEEVPDGGSTHLDDNHLGRVNERRQGHRRPHLDESQPQTVEDRHRRGLACLPQRR
jgi:hypothetical protein